MTNSQKEPSQKFTLPYFKTLEELSNASWESIKKNSNFFILALIVTVAIYIFNDWWLNNPLKVPGPIIVLAYILSFLVDLLIYYLVIKITLLNEAKKDISKLLPTINQAVRYALANLFYMLLVTFGLILLIIPGIYWAVKYYFVPSFIIDKNMGIKEAFYHSEDLTQGKKWALLPIIFTFNVTSMISVSNTNNSTNIPFNILYSIVSIFMTVAGTILYKRLSHKD